MEKNKNEKQRKNLIFGRYKIINILDEGSFGKVYLGLNIKNNKNVAIKLEPKSNPLYFLETEAYYLFILKDGIGIPKIETYGHNEKYNILVETLLGKSLQYLFIRNQKNFCIKDVLMIGIQIIERLKFVHSKNIIHRDIKPENFLIGCDDPYLIYLVDFGLSKKYRSERTGKHVQFSIPKRITGTARYSSLNALKGYQVSRRDDLECVAYVLIYFMRGNLPWEKIEAKTKIEKYRKIYKLKLLITPEKLCQNLPNEMCEFLKYTRNLDFEQEPNYAYCISLFNNALAKFGEYNDFLFSWINNLSAQNSRRNKRRSLEKSFKSNYFAIYDKTKRKSSPQIRIYHILQNSFKSKGLDSSSNTQNSFNAGILNENLISSEKIFSKDQSKINSFIANESSNYNYNNKNNNIPRKNFEKGSKNSNSIMSEKENNFEKICSNKFKNNTFGNNISLNNNCYQGYSERKTNNIIIEKIEKNLLTNRKKDNFQNKFKINNIILLKKFKNNSQKIKLNNEKKDSLKNNIEDISNSIKENLSLSKKNKIMKAKNEIRITNIYKTRINYKKNYFNNIIHNNSNTNFSENLKSKINKNNHRIIKISKNILKENKGGQEKYTTKINIPFNNNINLTIKENRNKNQVKKISNSYEKLYNNIIDISNEGGSKLNENIYNSYNNTQYIINNKNNKKEVKEKEKHGIKKIVPINNLNIDKKDIMEKKFKFGQISEKNSNKVVYLNYNKNICNFENSFEKKIISNNIKDIHSQNNSINKKLKHKKYLDKNFFLHNKDLNSKINNLSSKFIQINGLSQNNAFNSNKLQSLEKNSQENNKHILKKMKKKKQKLCIKEIFKVTNESNIHSRNLLINKCELLNSINLDGNYRTFFISNSDK